MKIPNPDFNVGDKVYDRNLRTETRIVSVSYSGVCNDFWYATAAAPSTHHLGAHSLYKLCATAPQPRISASDVLRGLACVGYDCIGSLWPRDNLDKFVEFINRGLSAR